jgi:hypothetical protein
MPGGRSKCAGLPPKSDSLSLLQFIACSISANDTQIHTPHAGRSVNGAVTDPETGVLLRRLSQHLVDIFFHSVGATPSGKSSITELTNDETTRANLLMPTSWLQTRIPPTNCASIFKERTLVSTPLEEKPCQSVGETLSSDNSTGKPGRWTMLRTFATYFMLLMSSVAPLRLAP